MNGMKATSKLQFIQLPVWVSECEEKSVEQRVIEGKPNQPLKQDYCSVWHHGVMSQQPCNSSRPPTVIYYHRISNGPIRESAKFWKFRRNDLPIVPNWPPRDTNWPHGLCDGRFGVKWRETISPISSLFFTFTIDQHLNFPATNSPSWTRHFVNDSFLPDAIYLIGFLRIFTARKVHEMSFLAHSKTTWINRF